MAESIFKTAVLAALATAPHLEQLKIEIFIADLHEMGEVGAVKDVSTVTLADLRKLQATADPAMRHLIEEIIKKRGAIPFYSTNARFSVDTLESIIRWYERKAAHRTFLIRYAKNLDTITKEEFSNYLLDEIIPLVPEDLTKNKFLVSLYCIICHEAVFASLRSGGEKTQIQHILASTMMDEIDESIQLIIRNEVHPITNWFSWRNLSRIFYEFKDIRDPVHTNLIRLEQLLNYNEALSELFVIGFWNTSTLYPVDPQDAMKGVAMDIRGFTKFQRLIFNITTVNPDNDGQVKAEYMNILQMVFRCLCAPNENFWSSERLNQIVQSLWKAIDRVDSEITKELPVTSLFQLMQDFIQPADRTKITFADFAKLDQHLIPGQTSQAGLCLGCLIDGRKYQEYDSRDGQ